MGFFQDLKEDLSMAVNELIPEMDKKLEEPEEMSENEKLILQDDETAAKESAQEKADDKMQEVSVEEAFRAAVDRLPVNAAFGQEQPKEETKQPEDVPEVEAPEAKEQADKESEEEIREEILIEENRPAEKAGGAQEEEPMQETEDMRKEEPAEKAGSVQEEEPVQETEIMQEEEPAEKAGSMQEEEPVQISEIIQEKPVEEIETVQEDEVRETETMQETAKPETEEEVIPETGNEAKAIIEEIEEKEGVITEMQSDLIKEVCEEVEKADEETELEKEVGKVMTQQNETGLTGEVLDETAVITKGMKVTGDISSQGSMDILGNVKGNVEILGKLNVSGGVEGNSIAEEIFADSAKITGEIHARGSVKVGQSSVIIGNIYATSAVIAGAVKGDIDVQGPVILDTSAIVMGNIKSKSVQINNGAVIEGMCSQCYADVNPSSFFKDLAK